MGPASDDLGVDVAVHYYLVADVCWVRRGDDFADLALADEAKDAEEAFLAMDADNE